MCNEYIKLCNKFLSFNNVLYLLHALNLINTPFLPFYMILVF